MKRFNFLTSFAVMGAFAMPAAYADIASNAENATCNSDTIGVSSGSTILEAIWNPQSKNCDAGTYLNSSSANCETCPTGSYCAGGTYTYNGSNIGITDACPTNYNSDEGASAQTDCYRACTTDDVAHSTEVTGRYYYGDNNQCDAISCAKGWHARSLYDETTGANKTNSTWAWVDWDGQYGENDSKGQEYYGITENNVFAIAYENQAIVFGRASCNSTDGTSARRSNSNPSRASINSFNTNSTGANCWCQIKSYKLNGSEDIVDIDDQWFLNDKYTDYSYLEDPVSSCKTRCAKECAGSLGISPGYWLASQKDIWFSIPSSNQRECIANEYSCGASGWLNAETAECETCPAGYYCGQGTYYTHYTYNGENQGINSCPAGYTSDVGNGSQSGCYITGIANCSDYVQYDGENSDKVVSVVYGNSDNGTATCKTHYGSDTCRLTGNVCDITSFECAAGWTANIGFDISNTNPTNSIWAYVKGSDNSFVTEGRGTVQNQTYYGVSESGDYAVDFEGMGTLRGTAKCSATGAGNYSIQTEISNSSGTVCWCNLTSFRPNNSEEWTASLSSWAPYGQKNSLSECLENCPGNCASLIGYFKNGGNAKTLVKSISIPKSCQPNTINIDWYNLGTLLQSNSCTYGQSDIVIPETPSRTGYTFGGWHVNNAE